MKNKKFIFDLDDTIIENQKYYNESLVRFLAYVNAKLKNKSPYPLVTLQLNYEIDSASVKKKGYDKSRFPESMVETYKKVCESKEYKYTQKQLNEVHKIGELVFKVEKGLINGAGEVLDYLLQEGEELLLLTKGDPDIQNMKIELNELNKYFKPENMHVVADKTKKTFEKIIGEYDKKNIYMVGNSVRSDVNPALKAGINVVYVPCETWVFEDNTKIIKEYNSVLYVLEDIFDLRLMHKYL